MFKHYIILKAVDVWQRKSIKIKLISLEMYVVQFILHNIKAEVRVTQENLFCEILHNEIKPHTTTQLLPTQKLVVRSLYHKVSMKACDEQ